MFKVTFREITKSLSRYLAILLIVALGVGFFSGLKITKPDMILTLNQYLDDTNFYEFKTLSTIGYKDNESDAFYNFPEVSGVEEAISVDALCEVGSYPEAVYKIHSIPESINKTVVTEGRIPSSKDECLLDGIFGSNIELGSKVLISAENEEDTLDLFKTKELTVVGLVRSPLYINFERGNSSVGSGKISAFIYVPTDLFDSEYSTEVYITLKGNYELYSDKYDDYLDYCEDNLKEINESVINKRFDDLINDAQKDIDEANKELKDKEDEAKEKLDKAWNEILDAEAEINDKENEINDASAKLNDVKKNIELMEQMLGPTDLQVLGAKSIYDNNKKEMDEGKRKLEDAKKELEDGKEEYYTSKEDFDNQIADAKAKLSDAQKELDDIEKPSTYIFSRNLNVGYACYESDSEIVNSISVVFPLFFFLVAALICITTMSRMVEEERTQIGIFKALGYGTPAIMLIYILYAGSAALIGSIGGYFLGVNLFPTTIWKGYQIMYNMGDISVGYNIILAFATIIVSLICACGAAYFSCIYELKSVPATLIRPKAPKNGKRILLERIGFVWNHMKFLHKVSARNIFRYKKRFIMMILGISGCTALLVTGFGLNDSIKDIVNFQYDEIQIYDLEVLYDSGIDEAKFLDIIGGNSDKITDYAIRHEENLDAIHGSKIKSSVYLEVPENIASFEIFFNIHDESKAKIPYPENNNCVITKKLSEQLELDIGDEITLRNSDMKTVNVPISGICENYVYNYIYMDSNAYRKYFDEEPEYKNSYLNILDDVNPHELQASLTKNDDVLSVTVVGDLRQRISTMMQSMDYIVMLVIASAAALAFIVLYNLTNINITERIREIATLKVLGFYSGETAEYVFRENIILTALGAFIGLFLGKLLHWFVMYNINIDVVSFKVFIKPVSYLYSFVLTLVFAMFVNFIMHFKIGKINMAESLKSNE